MVYIHCDEVPKRASFSFTFSVGPTLKFSFDRPISALPANRPFKRRRALSDVDGDGNEGRKKRRLRFIFCTSRLSRPFSQPATNIVNRGVGTKIAIWGKSRALGRNLLRKAAIMNRVRLRMDAAKDFMRQQEQKSRETLALREIVVQKPRHHDLPLPPSPLGLSNYDALDLEDEFADEDDEYQEHQNGIERTSSIYSDFNIMNPTSTGDDDYGYLDALDGISEQDLPDTPPAPPAEEGIIEILREKERQGHSYFVNVGG
ncbi:hypothetical protein D0Z07_4907 [Hyphodiscus hymeniophilus]|uniref:Uncharacterized protein n=1 Tax=Hyphodiscus hymeniophilus TaxID=353542 RepID=A0A9P7AX24_9HELO|nr:hypothetical protein D0Z07_4907 [Hyphodiscus hymeniophilus]